MAKKFSAALFMLVAVFWLPLLAFQQEGTNDKAKGAAAQANAGKNDEMKSAKQARLAGIVSSVNKDQSSLTIREASTRRMRVVHYDSSTQWTSQEHGKPASHIASDDVKGKDRVICMGHYGDKGEFHATLISKRLSEH
jgi:hypothetical protein